MKNVQVEFKVVLTLEVEDHASADDVREQAWDVFRDEGLEGDLGDHATYVGSNTPDFEYDPDEEDERGCSGDPEDD